MNASPPGSALSSDSSWHLTETYKALITLSVEALKMLALVNGGAAVAMLTYLGNLVSHGSKGVVPPNMVPALLCYGAGLLATVVAFCVAYVTQLRLYKEERDLRCGALTKRRHGYGVVAGITLAVIAAMAFGAGCVWAACALNAVHPY